MVDKQIRPVYEFGVFRLNPSERLLIRDGQAVPLAPKVFDTLLALVENPGRLADKEELMSRLWPDTFVEEATLARNISDLRKALGETSREQKYIETVPKRGYRFIASVKQLSAGTLIVERHIRSRVIVEEEIETGRAPRSIAVLPLTLIGASSSDEYLGLGMADALITRLSNIRQIVVRPTSAVFKYAGVTQDPVAAGRELNVESVLEGNIRRSGDGIRVTVQLVGVRDAASLWADKFDEKFTDIFAVEDSISERVVEALMLKLTGEERKLLKKHYTESTEAYQLYLKGRYYWNKRTAEALRKGIDCLERAIGIDPGYALAYGGLADCYTKLGDVGIMAIPPREAFSKAKLAAIRALQIDDSRAEAHATLAHLHMHHYEWAAAEREFMRAIELNPTYPSAHHWYAYFLAFNGRPDEALVEISFAAEADPLSLIINTDVGEILYFARRYDEAIERIQAALEMDAHYFAAHMSLALAFEQKQMYDEAIAEFETARGMSDANTDTLAALAHAYAISGRTQEALRLRAILREPNDQRYVSPYDMAIVCIGLREQGEALDWLGRAFEEQAEWMIYLSVDPRLDPVRADLRFGELLRRVGFEGQ